MSRRNSAVIRVGIVMACLGVSACGSTISPDAGNDDVTNVDVSTTDSSASDVTADNGPQDAGFFPDGATMGCANGGPACAPGLMCCAGVPYPLEGVCSTSCGAVSDRTRKQNFAAVDGDATLEALAHLPVTSWNYIGEPGVRHVGPMAQDFREMFGLGTDERTIHPIDENGVTIAALQALYRRVVRLEESNAALRDENRALRLRTQSHARH